MFGRENRWLAALTLLWLLVSLWLLRLAADTDDLLEDPPVAGLRTLALLLPAGTAIAAFLHARSREVRRPLVKALLSTVLLDALGWAAWIWTLDGHRGSGPALAVPLCLAALGVGALVGSRPAGEREPGGAG